MIRRIALRFVTKLAEVNRVDRMNLPQCQPLEILCVVARRIKARLSLRGAGNMAAVKEQLAGDLYRVGLKKFRVIR